MVVMVVPIPVAGVGKLTLEVSDAAAVVANMSTNDDPSHFSYLPSEVL